MQARRVLCTALVLGGLFGSAVPTGRTEDGAPPIARGALVDLRPDFERWTLPIKHQGARNTCSVCTTVGAMEYALSKKHDRAYPLSVEFLNWACNQVIGNRTEDRGQFFHDLLRGFKQFGICREEEMPYAAHFYPEYEPSERALDSAKAIKRLRWKEHWIRKNDGVAGLSEEQLAAIKDTLRKGWPVCAGSAHSVLFVGFEDDETAAGGGRFFTHDSGSGKSNTMSFAEAKERICDALWYEVRLR